MRAAVLVLVAGLSYGAIQRDPPNCSPRPCTYTLTCTSPTCNSTENGELQTVLNEAYLGDTIFLQAGRTWTAGSAGYQITARPGSGRLLITTTAVNSLPPLGTRITPHYIPYMASVKPSEHISIVMPAGSNAARNITLRGIYIPVGAGQNGIFRVGCTGSASGPEQMPQNIEVQQVIIRNTSWAYANIGYLTCFQGINSTLRDSYLQGAYDMINGSEKQAINSNTCRACLFLNNALLDIAGENMMLGGSGPMYEGGNPTGGEIAYNTFLNHKERMPTLAYAAGQRYMKGVVVVSGGVRYYANYSCVSTGILTNDACQWTQVSRRRHMKNIFEIKNAHQTRIHHNLFDGFWLADGGGADQYEAIVFKCTSYYPGTSSGFNCSVRFSGTCSTSGTTVTSTTPLPTQFGCNPGSSSPWHACCGTININGTNYSITNFLLDDPYSITIAADAGTQTNVPCSICAGYSCIPASCSETDLEYNVVRNSPQPFQFVDSGGCDYRDLGRTRIYHNLFYDLSCSEFAQAGFGCASWTTSRSQLLIAGGQGVHARFFNNTIIPKDNSFYYAMHFDGSYLCRGVPRGVGSCTSGMYPIDGRVMMRNNIMANGNQYAIHSSTPPEGTNATVLTTKMWRGTLTDREWFANVIVGANVTGYPGATRNQCPTTSGCAVNFDYEDPVLGKLFVDFPAKNFKVRHTYRGYDGETIGADWNRMPIMTKPSTGGIGVDVSVSAGTVTMNWNMSPDMAHIGCSIHLSSHWDMDTAYGSAPPPLPTSSYGGVRRQWQAELPSGTYYYELHCGSLERGEFTVP